MKVGFICGYYSDTAEKVTGVKRPRNPPFYEAWMFCLAVKSGEYHRTFYIEREAGRLNIDDKNFNLVRPTFGEWAAKWAAQLSSDPLVIVPVPSKDGVTGADSYRSLKMAQDALAGTAYADSVFDGLRWNKQLLAAHEGGLRSRAEFVKVLEVQPGLDGKNVVLIDDLFTTGASLLACEDKLTAAGAKVLGAVTCGKAVYDAKEPPFKGRTFDLTEELADVK
ncbi:MAG: phosphoribosyltransferase [Alphaproteobacteria bacterium]